MSATPGSVSIWFTGSLRRRGLVHRAEDVAYSRMQSTKPQTVTYGLSDSPAGLAAWIVDLFRAFSDCGGEIESRFTRDQILTNLTIYWATATIGHAMRGYYDYEHFETPPPPRRAGGAGLDGRCAPYELRRVQYRQFRSAAATVAWCE